MERPFQYIESSLLGGRTFRSLEHLNQTAAWWLTEVADVHVHRQTKARPIDRHAEELPHLIPLPARSFDATEVVYRTVDAEGFVVYRQNFYSVPWRLIGQSVAVRVTADELVIHDRAFVEAARHRLFPRKSAGQRSHQKDHEPPRDAQRRSEQLALRYSEFGAAGTRFLEGLLAGSRWGKSQGERVLSLTAAYPRADVLSALERAVQYGAFSPQAIERILTVRSRPKAPLDTLADDHRTTMNRLLDGEPTPPRPTSDYQSLLGGDSDNAEPTNLDIPIEPQTDRTDDHDGGPSPPW